MGHRRSMTFAGLLGCLAGLAAGCGSTSFRRTLTYVPPEQGRFELGSLVRRGPGEDWLPVSGILCARDSTVIRRNGEEGELGTSGMAAAILKGTLFGGRVTRQTRVVLGPSVRHEFNGTACVDSIRRSEPWKGMERHEFALVTAVQRADSFDIINIDTRGISGDTTGSARFKWSIGSRDSVRFISRRGEAFVVAVRLRKLWPPGPETRGLAGAAASLSGDNGAISPAVAPSVVISGIPDTPVSLSGGFSAAWSSRRAERYSLRLGPEIGGKPWTERPLPFVGMGIGVDYTRALVTVAQYDIEQPPGIRALRQVSVVSRGFLPVWGGVRVPLLRGAFTVGGELHVRRGARPASALLLGFSTAQH